MAKAKKPHSYLIDLVRVDEGGYTVVVPALPGCISYGETVAEATRNAREAIELHLENLPIGSLYRKATTPRPS